MLLFGQAIFTTLHTWFCQGVVGQSISLSFFFYSFVAQGSLLPSLCRRLYGVKVATRIYWVLYFSFAIGAFVQWMLLNLTTLNVEQVMLIFSGMSVASFFI